MLKNCSNCHKEFTKNKRYSSVQWERAKFCSQICQWRGSDRTKQGGSNKGKKWPMEKLKKNPVTPLQARIRDCFEYRQWRSDIFTRDRFTCTLCDQWGGKLVADHIESFRKIFYSENIQTLEQALACSRLWDINNGRTLCKNCHLKTENYGHKAKRENN